MTPPGPSPTSAVATDASFEPGRFDGTNINPVTLLATDYLNHFNEAIMLLEMLPVAPDCKEDFLAWRPMNYCEHFNASRFKHRDLAIAAYEVADPIYRRPLDKVAYQMVRILSETRDGLEGDRSHDTIRALAEATTHWLRPLVARAGAVINGEPISSTASDDTAPQDAIDLLFNRAVDPAPRA